MLLMNGHIILSKELSPSAQGWSGFGLSNSKKKLMVSSNFGTGLAAGKNPQNPATVTPNVTFN